MNRELSWLSFNARVLQEAEDPSVPLFERLFFLGVFSSNLDEFFRVRVASLRSVLRVGKKSVRKLGFNPVRLLGEIHREVVVQQERFGRAFRRVALELEDRGIRIAAEGDLDGEVRAWLRTYFDEEVRPHLESVLLGDDDHGPFLRDRGLYLVVELWPRDDAGRGPDHALVQVPPSLPRFVTPPDGGHRTVLFLDDVIRMNLPRLFEDHDVGEAYAVKLSRDAELYLDDADLGDEFAGNWAKMIRKSLSRRETGLPCRFLYDQRAPFALLERLKTLFGLESEDMVRGGRYHNLHDLMDFPRFGRDDLGFEPMPPLGHPWLDGEPSMLDAIPKRDRLVHFPYQRFDPVLRMLKEAVEDPDVDAVWATLYRVARDSAVVDSLVRAAERGKQVTAFVEAKARFDEARNLDSAERMEAAGVRVLHSNGRLKVHAKLVLVRRRGSLLAYVATGNLNEKTAGIYADLGLFTADERITGEVLRVFDMLSGEADEPDFEHLLVAPHAMRNGFNRLIDDEIERARRGEGAWMTLKMNSLEDADIIEKLYEASRAGVRVRLVVRGICCLDPGVDGHSENVEATSILDRYLEHARVYVFSGGGDEKMYIASADWMKRNLSRRVEVACPIYDPALRDEIRDYLDLQLRDNRKARVLDATQANAYVDANGPPVLAQADWYRMLASRTADR